MRAGHVRHRKPSLILAPRERTSRDVPVGQVERLVGDAIEVRVVPPVDARVVLVVDLRSLTAFDQQAARHRTRPRQAGGVVRIVMMLARGLGRQARARRQDIEQEETS